MLLICPPGTIGGTPRDWCGPAILGFIACIEGGGPPKSTVEKRESVSRHSNSLGKTLDKREQEEETLKGKPKNEYHTLPNKITITLKGSFKKFGKGKRVEKEREAKREENQIRQFSVKIVRSGPLDYLVCSDPYCPDRPSSMAGQERRSEAAIGCGESAAR